jgi:hypothetical protein
MVVVVAIGSSETSVIARATRHNIPEDGILHRLLYRLTFTTLQNIYD